MGNQLTQVHLEKLLLNGSSSLLAPAHLGGPGKRAVKWLWCGGVVAYPRDLVSNRSYKRKKIIEQQQRDVGLWCKQGIMQADSICHVSLYKV